MMFSFKHAIRPIFSIVISGILLLASTLVVAQGNSNGNSNAGGNGNGNSNAGGNGNGSGKNKNIGVGNASNGIKGSVILSREIGRAHV